MFFQTLLPSYWPTNNKPLQLRAILAGLCMLAGNAVSFLLPRQLGIVVDSFAKSNDKNPWAQVLIFAVLLLLKLRGGLDHLRFRLWLPVQVHLYRSPSTASYAQLHTLSSEPHTGKGSPDMGGVMGRETNLLQMQEAVCFHAITMLIDLVVASTYLLLILGPYEGFITATMTIFFYNTTNRTLSVSQKSGRRGASACFDPHSVHLGGIQCSGTAICSNRFPYENEHSATLETTGNNAMKPRSGCVTAWAFESLILLCGLLAGLLLGVCQVSNGTASPGQFVMLVTYWRQLLGPHVFVSILRKSIPGDPFCTEQFLARLKANPTVPSKKGALPLDLRGSRVTLKSISFSYDKAKDVLKDLSLDVAPCTTVALVGPIGAGKSTIFQLIGRMYDVTQGSIEIDGQDVRDLELSR
jgi:ABC-type transport system involved in Fe-S cluster assembly fused permease/ATPase subunit